MKLVFSPASPYKKQARSMAILWTLLVLIGCLFPGKDLPKVDVPLVDKWTHFVMFGVFAFLWLLADPKLSFKKLSGVFLASLVFGAAIEALQAELAFLGRSAELMDAVADAVGALIGMAAFTAGAVAAQK